MLLSLLLALRRHHCPCCVGAFALVALALLPLSPLRCCQHRKLLSAQSRRSRNTRWRHCQHRAIVVAGVVPASLPSWRGRLCPHHASVAALGTPALPPASQTGTHPIMTQSRHVISEALLSRSSSSPVASSLYPGVGPQLFGLRRFGQGSNDIFFGVALVSLPALHWRHCQCQAVLVAGVAPALSPSWPLKVWPVQRWCLPALHWHFARIALASLPALCCCCCCWRCAGVVSLGAWASLPSSRAPCGGVCPSTAIAVRGVLAVSGVIYARPPFSVA